MFLADLPLKVVDIQIGFWRSVQGLVKISGIKILNSKMDFNIGGHSALGQAINIVISLQNMGHEIIAIF